jgi:hypothetical protein
MKLRGRHFETVPDILRESQAALYSNKENDFHGAFEAVYVPKETILKKMTDKIE